MRTEPYWGGKKGSDLEDGGKSRKKVDAVTLIKEDMSIFGHCPAHDDFYLVVCNHCSQVVKPQAFQKHCERRHGALSKLYSRAHSPSSSRRDQVVNGETPTCRRHGGKPTRDRAHASQIRNHEAEKQEKPPKDNLRLFMPVVNLEKIAGLPKADGHGFRLHPKSSTSPLPGPLLINSQENPPHCSLAVSPNECLVPSTSVMLDVLRRKPESSPASMDKGTSTAKTTQKCQKKLSRKECDLNRQCGVLNPDTKRMCTRLITCKIHSVHQRREVQGRAKDFDVLVAELKANARNRESPKEKSPVWKASGCDRLSQDASALTSAVSLPCRSKQLQHALHRCRMSSESDLEEDVPSLCEGEAALLYLFSTPSEASEDEAPEDGESLECHHGSRPPQPQALCTFGSRLVGLGCYLFNRRLDRFCSAFSSMLERHLSSHMWKKIPPAAELPVPSVIPADIPGCSAVSAGPPSCTASSSVAREVCSQAVMSYAASSPHVAAACSQADCTGGSQAMTSPLPANTPSPSFSKLPSTKSSRSSRWKEGGSQDTEPPPRKRKQSSTPSHKRNCMVQPSPSETKPSLAYAVNGVIPSGPTVKRTELCASREHRPTPINSSKSLHPNCSAEEEGKKRKTLASYYRAEKPKHLSAASNAGCSARRKKSGSLLGFEEKRNTLKSKAH
ncbi:ataxin-7-like protein 2 isoform X2 [Rhinatrema bivittatum]|uniref:ataxin-7-like protein 2 isoform X2 n=1 Tax=Rhinatrema bivittatum TaxID=194408 RepID=UPI00112CCDE2|nr:ataxin-7-like protein 2 isoform X2 [Rhinatrema bivittatum]